MLGIISLYAADHFFAFVKMDADEDAVARAIRNCRAIGERNITVANSRHQRRQTLGLKQSIDPLRDVESQILIINRDAHCSGFLAAVARIENNQREWSWRGCMAHR